MAQLHRLAHDLRREAEEARRSKEQFVANVSHELRTPLNMIIGFSEMAMYSPETYGPNIPQALLADLEIVLRNSRHLSSLIDDVLDLSQIDAGQMALMKELTTLGEIIAAVATAVRPLFNSKGLYLRTDIPRNLPPLHCDRIRIRQVLLNLLSNAGRFTEKGGVWVGARQEGNQIVVSVADSGPGIKADEAAKVFKTVSAIGRFHPQLLDRKRIGVKRQQALCRVAQGQDVAGECAGAGRHLPLSTSRRRGRLVSRWRGDALVFAIFNVCGTNAYSLTARARESPTPDCL